MRTLGLTEGIPVTEPRHNRYQGEVNPGTTGINEHAEDHDKSENTASKKWQVEEIKKILRKTKTGARLLGQLPPKVSFGVLKSKEADKHAEYNSTQQTIFIRGDLTSLQAAPLAAHEILHAYQYINEGRPEGQTREFKIADQVAMEVEAKNAGLDVYEELGKPGVPYPYKEESERRKQDPLQFEFDLRQTYQKKYSAPSSK